MMKNNVFTAAAAAAFCTIFLLTACQKSTSPEGSCQDGIQNQGETGVDCGGPCAACMTKKDSIIADYRDYYLGSELTDPGWTGKVDGCDAGTAPQSTHDKVTMRLNYFRRLAGLNDNITLDVSKFARYQQTALMMKANNTLNHNPPNTWICWTSDGASGASTANLAIGSNATAAITAFMRDNGSGNQPVGHRRWILHSAKMQFSYGTTNSTMALGVIGVANGNTKVPPFIAYPPDGYIPQTIVFGRWSFSVPGANFSAAQVNMKNESGSDITVNVVSRTDNGYGDNTIVWEPQGIVTNSDSDISYTVTVSGITGAPQSSYNYTVTIVKP